MTPPGHVGRGIDRFLDRSVVLGFTRIGSAVRRAWWPEDLPPDALAGSVVAVTGANSGLDKATALGAARLGAEVRMLCRSLERGAEAREEILRAVPGARVHVDQCDISDLGSLPQVATDLRREVPRLRALVHNAGVLPHDRVETTDGHELTFATHVLGPHVLTDALRENLAADGRGRVVFVVSGGMYTQRLHIEDPEYTTGRFSGTVAYARTKRMQVHLAERWAEELADVGVTVHSVHPGWADTPGVHVSLPAFRKLTRPLLRTAEEGADTTVWLLAAKEAAETTGRFWHDRALRSTSYLSRTEPTPDEVGRLWDFVVAATGVPAR